MRHPLFWRNWLILDTEMLESIARVALWNHDSPRRSGSSRRSRLRGLHDAKSTILRLMPRCWQWPLVYVRSGSVRILISPNLSYLIPTYLNLPLSHAQTLSTLSMESTAMFTPSGLLSFSGGCGFILFINYLLRSFTTPKSAARHANVCCQMQNC